MPKKWLAASILAIVLPISLLATFKFTGILPEPQKPEMFSVHSIGWNMSRPSGDDVEISKWLENSYSDGMVSASLSVNIAKYYENDPGYPAYDNDYVKLGIIVVASVSHGLVYSTVIRFSTTDAYAFVSIPVMAVGGGLHPSLELHNLKLNKFTDIGTNEREAYVETLSENKPENCSASMLAYWIFVDEEKTTHFVTVSFEITYYDGTAYKRVEIPINLGVLKD